MKPPKSTIMLDAALAYARSGWLVAPLHTPTVDSAGKVTGCTCEKREKCTQPGKHPRTMHGLTDATTDETKIRHWWSMWDAANIAICTSENRVVIDVDTKHDGHANWADLCEQNSEKIPHTPLAVTGSGGHHLIFEVNDGGKAIINSASTVAKGVDVRGRGGYIVAPPSLSYTGRRYEWEVSSDIADTPLAKMPDWLAKRCRIVSKGNSAGPVAPSSVSVNIGSGGNHDGEVVSEGSRNTRLFSFGRSMRAQGASHDAIVAALLIQNSGYSPPLDDEEVRKVAASVVSKSPGVSDEDKAAFKEQKRIEREEALKADQEAKEREMAVAIATIPKPPPGFSKKDVAEALKVQRQREKDEKAAAVQRRTAELAAKTELEMEWERSGASPLTAPPLKSEFEVGDGNEIARLLMRVMEKGSSSRIVYDIGYFHRYDDADGVWKLVFEEVLYRQIGRMSGCPVGAKGIGLEINHGTSSGAIKLASQYRMQRDFFAKAPIGIAFTNGFVTVSNGVIKISPHSPENRARHQMGFAYDPNADQSAWEEFLDSVFTLPDETEALKSDSTKRDQNAYVDLQKRSIDRLARKRLLQEFIGVCMVGEATKYQRALVITGEGSNGKSVFISVVKALFPPDAVTEVNPQDWGDKDLLAELEGKRLNAVNEMPENELIDTPTIKGVITGSSKRIHRKYERAFELVPTAGHLLSCNGLPTTKDQTKGFWRRFMIVMFERDFDLDPDRKVGLEQALASLENLPGIALWALQGAALRQLSDAYSSPSSSVTAMATWRIESDQIRQWVDQCTHTAEQDAAESIAAIAARALDPAAPMPAKISEFEDYQTTSQDAYKSYVSWAKDSGHAQMTAMKFWRRLSKIDKKYEPQKHATHNSYAFRLLPSAVPAQTTTGKYHLSRTPPATSFQS